MSSKHSPPISTHSASETTKAPGDSPRRRCLTAATRFTAASSASTSSTRRRLRNSSPEIASPACPVSVGSSARKMIRPGPLSPLAAFTPRVSSFHRSWSLLPPAMITSTSDGKALRMRGFLVLRALPQQSAQRPPATTSRTATHRSRSEHLLARSASYEIWQAMAAGWDRERSWMWEASRAVSEEMLKALGPEPGQTILELAAGTGETGFAAARAIGPDGRLISTDFAPEMVAAARRASERLRLANVEHREMDAERMDLDDDSVDGVLCRWATC